MSYEKFGTEKRNSYGHQIDAAAHLVLMKMVENQMLTTWSRFDHSRRDIVLTTRAVRTKKIPIMNAIERYNVLGI
jgi:hypothetical protein